MNPDTSSSNGEGATRLHKPTRRAKQAAQGPKNRSGQIARSSLTLDLQVDFAQLTFFQARCREFQQQMADNYDQLARIQAQFHQPADREPEDDRLLLALASYYLDENRQCVEQLRTMQTEKWAMLKRPELLAHSGEEASILRVLREGLRQIVVTADAVLAINRSDTEGVRQLQGGSGRECGMRTVRRLA